MTDDGIAGAVAVVTGAGSGIGRAIAIALDDRGATVMCADLNAEAAAATASQLHSGVSGPATDVRDHASVERCFALARELGPVAMVAHSAGIGREMPFLNMSARDWTEILDVDLTGTFNVGQVAARHMVAGGGGRILNLASTAGVRGGFGRAAYGAAKGGVIMLTRVMAVELAPYGILVNALAPGAIETELVAKMHSPETRTVYRRAIPLDRYGTPQEVAAAALFLLSARASYITGQIVGVDGGFLAAGLMRAGGKTS